MWIFFEPLVVCDVVGLVSAEEACLWRSGFSSDCTGLKEVIITFPTNLNCQATTLLHTIAGRMWSDECVSKYAQTCMIVARGPVPMEA